MSLSRFGTGGGGGFAIKRYNWDGNFTYQIPDDATDIFIDPQISVSLPQGTITALTINMPLSPQVPYFYLHFGGTLPTKSRVVQGINFHTVTGQQIVQMLLPDAVNTIVYSGQTMFFRIDTRNGVTYFHRQIGFDEHLSAFKDNYYQSFNGGSQLVKADGASGQAGTIPATTLAPYMPQAVQAAIIAAASTTVDLSAGGVVPITMSANITTLTISNGTAGNEYLLKLTQDATGGRTVTWPASVKWKAGTAPTLSGANKTDLISLRYDGTTYYGTADLNY